MFIDYQEHVFDVIFAQDRRIIELVVLADDHQNTLETIAAFLAADFEIIAAVPEGRQAVSLTLRLDPDIVVLDYSMPELNGVQALRELRPLGSQAKTVLNTLHDTDELVS